MDAGIVAHLLNALGSSDCDAQDSVSDALKYGDAEARALAVADLKTIIGAAQTLLEIVDSGYTEAAPAKVVTSTKEVRRWTRK